MSDWFGIIVFAAWALGVAVGFCLGYERGRYDATGEPTEGGDQ